MQLMHIRRPTIQTYKGPQGPGTMLLKSGTVLEIWGPQSNQPAKYCMPIYMAQ